MRFVTVKEQIQYFSIGNVMTIVAGVAFAFTMIMTVQISQATAEKDRINIMERVVRNEVAIKQLSEIKSELIELSVNQRNILRHLENNGARN